MKGGSVPAHVTDWNDEAAEESAANGDYKTFCRHLDAISRKQGAKRRSVLAHVTEQSNAVDEESAANGDYKTFCRQLDANSRKQGAKRRSVLAHVTEQSNAVDEESAPTGEQKGEFSVWLVLLVGRKHRARAAPVLRTGNNAKSG